MVLIPHVSDKGIWQVSVMVARSKCVHCQHGFESICPWQVSENAHNSWITWYILIKFAYIKLENPILEQSINHTLVAADEFTELCT